MSEIPGGGMSYSVIGDWGTSNFRLFRIVDAAVTDRTTGPGIGALTGAPDDVLRSALAPWSVSEPPGSVTLCGMIGSRNGWRDVPYADCPADAASWASRALHLALGDIPVTIAAGLACVDPRGTPDVMRGEETQIFGAMAAYPELAAGRHLVVLPGTHSKWVTLEDGRVVGFKTYLTGELFALLRNHSTLTRAGGATVGDEDASGFRDGLLRARSDGRLLGSLFEARSRQLRTGSAPEWAVGFLSGLAIGSEIAEALAGDGTIQDLTLIGERQLANRYADALASFDLGARKIDGEACAISGLGLLETTT
jgi:2-dehydro-3-deoxygalactonokinase